MKKSVILATSVTAGIGVSIGANVYHKTPEDPGVRADKAIEQSVSPGIARITKKIIAERNKEIMDGYCADNPDQGDGSYSISIQTATTRGPKADSNGLYRGSAGSVYTVSADFYPEDGAVYPTKASSINVTRQQGQVFGGLMLAAKTRSFTISIGELASATKSINNNGTRIDFLNATPRNLLVAKDFTAEAETLVDEAFAQPIFDEDKCQYTSS